MTRAMLVTVLWRLDGSRAPAGRNTFTDVPGGQWFTDAVTWAAENGVVNGVGSGKFRQPDGRADARADRNDPVPLCRKAL